jgi:hypothetical protein
MLRRLPPTYNDFVAIEGMVHLFPDLDVFLDVQGRRIFIPGYCMEPAFRSLRPGEIVTLQVLRRFAEEERLVV